MQINTSSRHAKITGKRVSLLSTLFMLLSLAVSVEHGIAGDSVTVTSINEDTRLLTVRNNRTGVLNQIKIDSTETLKSLEIGEVLPKPAGLRAKGERTCFERCIITHGTTAGQCAYWCDARQ